MAGFLPKTLHNEQNRRSSEMYNCIFETYKNSAMPHGFHNNQTAYEIAIATMCAYPPSQHALPHWKCVFLIVDIVHALISQVNN